MVPVCRRKFPLTAMYRNIEIIISQLQRPLVIIMTSILITVILRPRISASDWRNNRLTFSNVTLRIARSSGGARTHEHPHWGQNYCP